MSMTTTAPLSLMTRLKEATTDLHRHAETRVLQRSLITGSLGQDVYRRYLVELHAVHAALERSLDPWRSREPAVANVLKNSHAHSENLRADIDAIGIRTGQTGATIQPTSARQRCLDFIAAQAEQDVHALLGCLYVLEGSMNGNKFIARALARAWQMDRADGLRYLDPYGEAQRDTWQAFRAAMESLEVSEMDIETAASAACAMFQFIADISDEVNARAT